MRFLKNPFLPAENSDEMITARERIITSAIPAIGKMLSDTDSSPLIIPAITLISVILLYMGRHMEANGVKKRIKRIIRTGEANEDEMMRSLNAFSFISCLSDSAASASSLSSSL